MVGKIIHEIEKLSGNYSGYEIFSDWIKASAICISNNTDIMQNNVWRKREEEYMALAKKHGKNNMQQFSNMLGMLAVALEDNIEDVLGKIYMQAGLGSKQTGQFFTPFHVSSLTSRIALSSLDINAEKIKLNEPSVGGGGMIIAAAKELKERGVNYQKVLEVTANDLDWKGVYMSYVQFSLLGIKAVVIQGDTLSGKKRTKEQYYYTPAWKGAFYERRINRANTVALDEGKYRY